MARSLLVVVVLLNTAIWQGCAYEVVPGPVNCDENPVIIALGATTDSNCALKDGSIEVEASGGTGVYRYMLGDGKLQDQPRFEGVGAGVYDVTVIDQNTCSATMEVTIRNSAGMNISFATTEAGGCGNSNGTLTVTAIDGVEPYQYRLNEGSYLSTHEFTGLSRGLYHLTVADASGCEVIQPIRIKSGVSYSASVAPIIERSCAVNDCHNGSQFPDFRVFKNVRDHAIDIKFLTADGTMPQEGTLTQHEINTIACWVDDGAPDN